LPDPVAESAVFFLDENTCGLMLIHALRNAGARVELATENFERGAADAVWIPEVTQRKWVIITADERIRYRPNEKAAFLRAGAKAFLLVSHGRPFLEVVDGVVMALPKMIRQSARPGPFACSVHADGSVRKVKLESQ
jgi:hypothetical protein